MKNKFKPREISVKYPTGETVILDLSDAWYSSLFPDRVKFEFKDGRSLEIKDTQLEYPAWSGLLKDLRNIYGVNVYEESNGNNTHKK